jgi:hypothetical protein
MWTLGTKNPLDTVTELQKYTLAGVAQRIKSDVLILCRSRGSHFVPIEEVAQFEKALTAVWWDSYAKPNRRPLTCCHFVARSNQMEV